SRGKPSPLAPPQYGSAAAHSKHAHETLGPRRPEDSRSRCSASHGNDTQAPRPDRESGPPPRPTTVAAAHVAPGWGRGHRAWYRLISPLPSPPPQGEGTRRFVAWDLSMSAVEFGRQPCCCTNDPSALWQLKNPIRPRRSTAVVR